MAQILIRQLEERVVEILRARAQRRGLSLEQSLRDLLTAAAAEQDDLWGRLAELRRQTPASGRQLDVAAPILGWRPSPAGCSGEGIRPIVLPPDPSAHPPCEHPAAAPGRPAALDAVMR